MTKLISIATAFLGRSARAKAVVLSAAVATLAAAAFAPPAQAQDVPHWVLTVTSGPTEFAPGDTADQYTITAVDTGGAATDGTPITITDTLPPGVTATPPDFGTMQAVAGSHAFEPDADLVFDSQGAATCDQTAISCEFTGAYDPGDSLSMTVTVSVASSLSGSVINTASVSGGGAPGASATVTTPVGTSAVPFGLARGSFFAATSTSQAGAHPNLTTSFTLNRDSPHSFDLNPKAVAINLPPGLVGSATAAPQCDMDGVTTGTCPQDTMVGIANVSYGDNELKLVAVPIYNITPYQSEPAAFAFIVSGIPIRLDTSIRSGTDYGITATTAALGEGAGVLATTVTLWGVPAEHNGPGPDTAVLSLNGSHDTFEFGGPGSGVRSPLLTNPTECSNTSGGTVTIGVDTWPQGSTPSQSASAQTSLPAVTGCDKLQFHPSLTVQPDTTVADSPAGVNAELKVPQDSNPDGLATPELRNATVTLPAGLSVSPGAAAGLQGCTDAEIALHSTAPATCPNASQIGTVSIHTPLLPDTLTGQIYLGTPNCDPCTNADAQDGNMLRGFIQAQGSGVIIKLPGFFTADPTTGQLTAHFLDNPQQPFDDLQLRFKGGPLGIVATPDACGIYTSNSDLQPWSAPFTPDALGSDSFQITSGCVNGFSPSFTAGVMNAQAGAYSPFVLSFQRSDSDQYLSGLSVKLPTGMLAKLAGVPLCPDADANAGGCPAASQVGTVETGAGPGPDPFFLSGKAYLTGPYKGGPYGLAVEVPVIAGPFNLGTVVVRQALRIDPTTAQVTAVSDPFPTILDGIPLRIRRIDVTLNRPNFTLNPTSCNPMSVTGTLTSTGGLSDPVSSHFQVGGCQDLGFSPKLKIALTGKGKTHSGNHPTLTATLTDPSGQANIRMAKVALPLSLALDPKNSQNVCNYNTAIAVHGGAVACPSSTVVGTATAVTPLLSQPLTGPVYLVQGIRFNAQGQAIHTLPSLLIPLRGQIALDLRAQSAVSGGKLVTTFSTIPDAPVSKFTLKINGGRKGILVITGRGKTICGKKQMTDANFGAQSGKAMRSQVKMSTPCKATKKKKGARHRK